MTCRSLLTAFMVACLTALMAVPAEAQVQPIVLFKQTIRIGGGGGGGGRLSGACGISIRDTPSSRDRFGAFPGNALVTRFEQGMPPMSVPFADAVDKHKWLEVAGAGNTSSLMVRPTKPDEKVEYQIDIRETTPAIPAGDDSAEIKEFLKNFSEKKALFNAIEDTRRVAAEVGDTDVVDFQRIIWDLEPGAERSTEEIELELNSLKQRWLEASREPDAKKQLAATLAEVRKIQGDMERFEETLKENQRDELVGVSVLRFGVSSLRHAILDLKPEERQQKLTKLRRDLGLLRTLAARREAYRKPTIATILPAEKGELFVQIGSGPKVQLQTTGAEKLQIPKEWAAYGDRPILLDMTELDADQYKSAAEALVKARQQGLQMDLCFKRSPDGEANFAAMTEWDKVRVLGDSTSLDKLPESVRGPIVDWIKELAVKWNEELSELNILPWHRVELFVDHFDKDGVSLKALEARIKSGEMRDTFTVALLCNVDMQAFLKLADVAVRDGKAKLFSFPSMVMQARVSPLLVESMMSTTGLRDVSPMELPVRACRDVRERLAACLNENDAAATQAALRREFTSRFTERDPAILFLNERGEFRVDLVKEMITFLDLAEKGFINVTISEKPKLAIPS